MDSQPSPPVVGIDVSKATLAICYQVNDQVKHLEVSNSKMGFQQLVKTRGAQCLFVMEDTGTYNLALAYYLHEQGGQVAVLNPLVKCIWMKRSGARLSPGDCTSSRR